jgi:hypothetical protein
VVTVALSEPAQDPAGPDREAGPGDPTMAGTLAATAASPSVAAAPRGRARFVPILVSIVSIWVAVVFASIYAPALIAGSERETLALAAVADWLWGGLATAFILLAAAFSRPEATGAWWMVALVTAAVWVGVALVSVYAPSLEAGTDPTIVPIGSLLAPIVGVLVTGYLSVFAAGMSAQRTA